MAKSNYRHECHLIGVSIICAFLSIFGHLILSKFFTELSWVEYIAACIPFIMMALCLYGFYYAGKHDDR